jgi:hypothetical protein
MKNRLLDVVCLKQYLQQDITGYSQQQQKNKILPVKTVLARFLELIFGG